MPSDEYDLTPTDAFAFDMTVLLAAELGAAGAADEVRRHAQKSAEVVTAGLLGLIHRES